MEHRTRKVVLITGGTGAIGQAMARLIAAKPGYEVVLVARKEGRARQVVEEIIAATRSRDVRYELVDVSRKESAWALAERWEGPLDILINNAATAPRQRMETPEGIELQWATNVLGYVWFTQAFGEILQRTAQNESRRARIINVASYWAGDLDLEDVEFKMRRYRNGAAYRQSKQANRMLTAAFARQFESQLVAINACHPGDVNSKLSNALGFGGSTSPDEAARTPVWLATESVGGRETGRYFERRRAVQDRFVEDWTSVESLYQLCLTY